MHVLNTSIYSGAENVVCQIISLHKGEENKFSMIYCCKDGPIRNVLEEMDIPSSFIKKMSIKELKSIIKKEKPDIIHAHDMKASFMVFLSCGKTPFVCHIHNNAFDSRTFNIKSFLFYLAAKKAKHIFWVSKSSFDGYRFKNKIKLKSTVLYNVIDKNALINKSKLDPNQYDFDVIYLGRLTYQKNPLRMIEICQSLVKRRPSIKIAIVGSGELELETKKKAEDLGLAGNITFFGYLNNPLKILACSKAMLMTSLWEGTPMCALEAMAFGVPIFSTPVDGLQDLIVNDENGFLSESNEILVDKIEECLKNAAFFSFLSNNQQKRFEEWNDLDTYKSKIDKAYDDALTI